jgi:hypothetical protein
LEGIWKEAFVAPLKAMKALPEGILRIIIVLNGIRTGYRAIKELRGLTAVSPR